MEQPGKLYDFLGDVPSHSDDPALSWEQAGARINRALADRHRRRRRWFYWLFVGVGLLGLGIAIGLSQTGDVESLAGEQAGTTHLSPPPSQQTLPMVGAEGFKLQSTAAVTKMSNLDQTRNSSSVTTTQLDEKPGSQPAGVAIERTAVTPASGQLLGPATPELVQESPRKEQAPRDAKLAPVSSNTPLSNRLSSSETASDYELTKRMGSSLLKPLVSGLSLLPRPDTVDLLSTSTLLNIPQTLPKHLSWYVWTGTSLTSLRESFAQAERRLGFSGEFGLRYRWSRNFYCTVGLAYGQDRIQTAFIRRTPVTLYRPGTVDTIYRYSTGQEEVITTDSIPGVEIQNFRHTSDFNQLGIPVQFGFTKQWKKLTMQAEIGLLPLLFQQARGVVTNAAYELTDISTTAALDFQLSYRFSLGFEIPLGSGRLGLRYLQQYQPAVSLSVPTRRQALQVGYRWSW